jgi:hypothetical protein
LKEVSLEGVYYGAFEARENKEDPEEPAPIFDLTPFVELMDWSQAVTEFVKYGHSEGLRALVHEGTESEGKRSKGQLRSLAADLDKTSRAITQCRGKMIFSGDPWRNIPNIIKKLKKSQDPPLPAFNPILELVETKIKTLEVDISRAGPEVRNGLGAVRWCLKHKLIQQAYAILQETLISHLCRLGGMDYTDKDCRELAGQCPRVREVPYEEWLTPAKDEPEKVEQICDAAGEEFLKAFNELSDLRNDIMHCKPKSDKTPEQLEQHISRIYDRILQQLSIEV